MAKWATSYGNDFVNSVSSKGRTRQRRARSAPLISAPTFHTLIALMTKPACGPGRPSGWTSPTCINTGATLTVTGKYSKIRMLPLHPTVLHGLTAYLQQRDQLLPPPLTGPC